MNQSNSARSKVARKRVLNRQLSVLSPFVPLNDWQAYRINRTTAPSLLHDLIQLARRTTRYTIDTEHDYYTHEAALIQIEFIRRRSVVLLIEMCHLPPTSTVTFWLIKSLLAVILSPSNFIYSWGNGIDELGQFVHYDLFSSSTIRRSNNIDVQVDFKLWYNKVFLHTCGLQPHEHDHSLCTCIHRPVKHRQDQWSLQKAIAYAFGEFLDKSRTNSKWRQQLIHSDELVRYAVNDCLAVTKLHMLIDGNWTKEQLEKYNQRQCF
ncbi:unnamed protein product [Adineta ricciae]|uniref:Uncharacterized protein n=1 Tax=Adineta ricciae TaxID=249248 RepID=A0A815VFB8_ADIRI|nr:unnamed protein product [Adineta ricciae]CAF1569490.1 unnamed protein product [Adineta ricciae]